MRNSRMSWWRIGECIGPGLEERRYRRFPANARRHKERPSAAKTAPLRLCVRSLLRSRSSPACRRTTASRSGTRRRSGRPGSSIRQAARPTGSVLVLLDPQTILDVCHAGNRLCEIFSTPFIIAISNRTSQRHFSVLHHHLDIRSVEIVIVTQAIVDVFFNPLIGAAIAFWSASAVVPLFIHATSALGLVVTKPRRDFV